MIFIPTLRSIHLMAKVLRWETSERKAFKDFSTLTHANSMCRTLSLPKVTAKAPGAAGGMARAGVWWYAWHDDAR